MERQRLSPREVAARLGVGRNKVMAWIRSGELAAVNLAESLKKRPQFAVSMAAIEAFEASRAVKTPRAARPRPQASQARERCRAKHGV